MSRIVYKHCTLETDTILNCLPVQSVSDEICDVVIPAATVYESCFRVEIACIQLIWYVGTPTKILLQQATCDMIKLFTSWTAVDVRSERRMDFIHRSW